MNGIKMSNCRFYVDKENRTVVCVIPHTQNLLIDFIHEHFRWGDIDLWCAICSRLEKTKLLLPRSFVGKAVCSPDDEWDEETGMLIAFSKAKDKCYKSFFKRANTLVQTIDRRLGDAIELFNDFGLKLEVKRDALHQEIKNRTSTNEPEVEETDEE